MQPVQLFLVAPAEEIVGVGTVKRDEAEAHAFIESDGGLLVVAGFEAE